MEDINKVYSNSVDKTLLYEDRGTWNTTTGVNAITYTLPSANQTHIEYTFRKDDDGIGKIVINTIDEETIDGLNSKEMLLQNESVTIISDGMKWISKSDIKDTKPIEDKIDILKQNLETQLKEQLEDTQILTIMGVY